MSSLNRVQIIGNLGRDPEIRQTQAGDKVATINVAITEKWTDRNSGERRSGRSGCAASPSASWRRRWSAT